ncbi:sororin [Cyprinodon tularosa]|uniref:sororin n=1 Tax=Cyprinodon tularosa TaxID=77115 RepID=UPI0018E239B7|nr:sororin [Cyprinodon tularosa]
MSEGTPRTAMAEANHLQASRRRTSPRFGSAGAPRERSAKMAPGEKRSITVRKIAPRKTTALSDSNKENTPKNHRETTVTTPKSGPDRLTSSAGKRNQRQAAAPSPIRGSSSTGKRRQQQAAAPSPILASSPPASSQPPDLQDSVWTQKVRRSYSRISDSSLHSPGNREDLFGFERLHTPEVVRSRVEHSRGALEVSGSLVSMLEADECCPEPDPNIPGVAVVKEKRSRRRRVQPIDSQQVEVLVAQMNAEFQEAEEFELVVE